MSSTHMLLQTFRRRVFRPFSRSVSSMVISPTPWNSNKYPAARRCDHVDTYQSAAKGEVRIADPYRWLEEYTEETDKWTSSQEAFTREFLDKNVDRKLLEGAFRASMDYAKVPRIIGVRVNVIEPVFVSSSAHRLCVKMAAGTGFITAGYRLNRVSNYYAYMQPEDFLMGVYSCISL
jgi:hypothetical protein